MSDPAQSAMNASAPFKIRFRYANYGVQFKNPNGFRQADPKSEPENLRENEVAVDVGNICWKYHGSDKRILDHHFEWENGCPSAAVAVLYHVDELASWAEEVRARDSFPGEFWITTHHNPDFDAYCSANLVRWILQGELTATDLGPLGLTRADFQNGGVRERLNWFAPRIPAGLSAAGRSALLLAAVASCVDQCRRMILPREYQLHSVLYAAARRGRWLAEDGASEFFEYVRRRIQEDHLNPLIDLIFNPSEKAYSNTDRDKRHPFTNEVELLSRETALYRSDLTRARRIYVQVPRTKVPFSVWFAPLKDLPFFNAPGAVDQQHLSPPHQQRCKVEGVFLRDPQSLLFKEWVREDREHAISEEGALFTAIAYSNERSGAKGNSTKYIFSLDPERARGRHLYPLWARLQRAELEAGGIRECLQRNRPDFEGRKVGEDPWFDGNSYEATIIDTPNDGTALKPGTSVDLSDTTPGTVEVILREELEFGWYLDDARTDVWDYPVGDGFQPSGHVQVPLPQILPVPAGMLRFAHVALDEETATDDPKFAAQLARDLWPLLQERPPGATPTEPAAEHVVAGLHAITVWNRNGVVAASRGEAGKSQMEALRISFQQVAELQQGINRLLQLEKSDRNEAADQAGEKDLYRLQEGANLSRMVTVLELEAAKPEGLALQRFLVSTRFQNVLRSLHALNESAANEAHARTLQKAADEVRNNVAVMKSMQTKVEYVEIFLIGIYSIYIVNYLGEALHFAGDYRALCLVLGPLIASYIAAIKLEPWKHADHDQDVPDAPASAPHDPLTSSEKRMANAKEDKSRFSVAYQNMRSMAGLALGIVLLYVVFGFLFRDKDHASHADKSGRRAESETRPDRVSSSEENDAGARHSKKEAVPPVVLHAIGPNSTTEEEPSPTNVPFASPANPTSSPSQPDATVTPSPSATSPLATATPSS